MSESNLKLELKLNFNLEIESRTRAQNSVWFSTTDNIWSSATNWARTRVWRSAWSNATTVRVDHLPTNFLFSLSSKNQSLIQYYCSQNWSLLCPTSHDWLSHSFWHRQMSIIPFKSFWLECPIWNGDLLQFIAIEAMTNIQSNLYIRDFLNVVF